MSLGIGVVYEFAPFLASRAEAGRITNFFKKAKVRRLRASRLLSSATHMSGFRGHRILWGPKRSKLQSSINKNGKHPDFVLFTGDLTHDTESRDVHAQRMKLFKSIAGRINTSALHMVPGENDAALDGGVLYREHFGETHYSFDHKGVHFVALDNVSRGRPEIGSDQLAWLKADVARFPRTAPIVVFTHRPLFDLKPEWEWFTADGDDVMNVLAPYENVTVLYGHIHRHHFQQNGRVKHYAARSLICAFNDPATNEEKKQLPFNRDDPFKELGIRTVTDERDGAAFDVNDVVLTRTEFSGLSGMQQMLKDNSSSAGGSSNDID